MKQGSQRKGIGTLIAALFVFAALFFIIGVFVYVNNLMMKTQRAQYERLEELVRRYDVSRSIIAYYDYYPVSSTLSIIVTNTGQEPILVKGVAVTTNASTIALLRTDESVAPGETRLLQFKLKKGIEPRTITIVLRRGAVIAVKPSSAIKGTRHVYIINVTNAWSNWGNAALLTKLLLDKLGSRLVVHVITSFDELYSIVSNPPDDVIIINAHDEVVPMPPSWPGSWQDYFKAIGRNIRDHGWIWIHTQGYPFYYYDQGTGSVSVGSSGASLLLSVAGSTASFWSGSYGVTTANKTLYGRILEASTGIPLPETVDAVRQAFQVAGMIPVYVFYEYRGSNYRVFYASAAYSLGRGLVVFNGLSGSEPLSEVADIVAAEALFFASYYATVKPYIKSKNLYLLGIPGYPTSWFAANGDLSASPGSLEEYIEATYYITSSYPAVIDDPLAFENLLFNPPDNASILNLHGESVPLPPSFYSPGGYSESSYISVHFFDGYEVVDLHKSSDVTYAQWEASIPALPVSLGEGYLVEAEVVPLAPEDAFRICLYSSTLSYYIVNASVRLPGDTLYVAGSYNYMTVDLETPLGSSSIGQGYVNTTRWYRVSLLTYISSVTGGGKPWITYNITYNALLNLYDESGVLIGSTSRSFTLRNLVPDTLRLILDGSSHDSCYLLRRISVYRVTVDLATGAILSRTLVFTADASNFTSIFSFFVYALSAPPAYARWRALFSTIVWNVNRHGWRWCSLKGYPFFYVSLNGSKVTVTGSGWDFVRYCMGVVSSTSLSVIFGGSEDYVANSSLLRLDAAIPDWVAEGYIARPLSSYSGLGETFYYNSTLGYSGATYIPCGKGAMVILGFSGSYEVDCTALDVALAILSLER